MTEINKSTTLKREYNWFDCAGLIIGIMIGTGIFSTFPTLIAKHNPSILMILFAWIFGGLFSWFGAMCYAELSSIFPHKGGDYTFLHRVYSYKGESVVSFLYAWTKVFVIRPSSIAVLSLIFGYEIQNIFFQSLNGNGSGTVILIIALSIVLILTMVNILGIGVGKNVQNSITVVKIAIVLFIIIFGLIKAKGLAVNLSPLIFPQGNSLWSTLAGFWGALVLSMWVYGGWNEAVYVAEETKDPGKNIPKALFVGIFSITLLYLGVNFVYMLNFSPSGLANTFNPASDLFTKWFGLQGGIVMSTIIAVSAAGAINGLIMTGGRISHAVANDYPSLEELTPIHPIYRTPSKALIANFVITAVLLFLSRGKMGFVENLTFYTAGVFWYFFGLVVISLMIMRRLMPADKIPYKIPFYPFSPILFLFVTVSLIWGAIEFKPFETLAGISILTLGIPLYYILNLRKQAKTEKE